MRRMKKISQDEASKLCGYSRATIGHIENGRIELSRSRIEHILRSYGYKYSEFEENMSKEELRDSVVDYCLRKINHLDDNKLGVIKSLLNSM
ncbi:MAG: helix-turn-helix transcriptional regulator [Bdellovibrionota bacterium]|nr:helix-turn-helix transcriptional regulator [Bdellovibrionota bacterium]